MEKWTGTKHGNAPLDVPTAALKHAVFTGVAHRRIRKVTRRQ